MAGPQPDRRVLVVGVDEQADLTGDALARAPDNARVLRCRDLDSAAHRSQCGDVVVALASDACADLAWTSVVRAGAGVVMTRWPGTAAVLREAVAFDRAVLVARGGDMIETAAAAARSMILAPAQPASLLTAMSMRAAGEVPDTAPQVLAVVLSDRDAAAAARAARTVLEVGGGLRAVALRQHVENGPLVAGADVVISLDDPTRTTLQRAERLLLLRIPALVATRSSVAATRSARAHAPATAAARLATVAGVAHTRGWQTMTQRLLPWFLARQVDEAVPRLLAGGAAPLALDRFDVLMAPSPDATAAVWRLLRAAPRLQTRSSVPGVAVSEVVRGRTESLVVRTSSDASRLRPAGLALTQVR